MKFYFSKMKEYFSDYVQLIGHTDKVFHNQQTAISEPEIIFAVDEKENDSNKEDEEGSNES